MIRRVRSIRPWFWYFLVGCLCAVLFTIVSDPWGKAAVQMPAYAGSAALLTRAWWKRRTDQPDPLMTLAVVAFGAYFAASIWGVLWPLAAFARVTTAVPSPLDGLFLLSYALLALFLWRVGSRSAGMGRRDILDMLVVTGGFAPVFWVVLIDPLLGTGAPIAATVTYVAYPTMVFGLLAMTVRLAFVAGRRATPHLLLAGWVLFEQIPDIIFLDKTVTNGYVYGQWWQAMWILSAACIGALALHPRTGLLFERSDSRPVSGTGRLYVLAACLALPIATIGYTELRVGRDLALLVPCVGALILVVLLCMRLSGLMIDNAAQARVEAELRRLSDDLTHQALHDPLTGLGNRLLFADRADNALAQRPTDSERAAAILLLDLDDFKTVNDAFGHEAGDRVLVDVSRRLESVTRQGEGIFRLGGDEFAFVLSQARLSDVLSLADRIGVALAEPLDLGPRMIRPLATIGISIALSGQDRSTLLAEADMAMYDGKTRNTNTPSVFDPILHQATLERHQLERDLRDAIEHNELRLLYQPIVRLASNAVVGVEALIRWEHPTRGTVGPVEFIPLAEENGSISDIGDWVLEEALRQLMTWDDMHPGSALHTSVNVSPRQLADPEFVNRAAGILRLSGIAPERVTLEITEASFGKDADVIIERLHHLKALGLTLAIDDFGTDYSSLSHLQRLPADTLKIDKSFVDQIGTSAAAWALTTAIVQLAHSLGKTTIAEGVETGGQLAHLRSLNVELAQGFLFARPLTPDAIDELLSLVPDPALAPGEETIGSTDDGPSLLQLLDR